MSRDCALGFWGAGLREDSLAERTHDSSRSTGGMWPSGEGGRSFRQREREGKGVGTLACGVFGTSRRHLEDGGKA